MRYRECLELQWCKNNQSPGANGQLMGVALNRLAKEGKDAGATGYELAATVDRGDPYFVILSNQGLAMMPRHMQTLSREPQR